jgi:hypothetical protein
MRLGRTAYVGLALITIAVGLAVHRHGSVLSNAARDVLGDALWAAMIVWWISALAPAVALSRRALTALAFCVVVELSQLYQSPGLDAIRRTTVGHLFLGSGFDPRDFAAYAFGVLAAVIFERAARARRVAIG